MAFKEPVESEEYFPEKLKVAFSFITGFSMLPILMDPKHTQCLAESVGVSQGTEKGFVKKLRVFVDLEDTVTVLQYLGVEDTRCYFNLSANIYYSRCFGRCMETEVVVKSMAFIARLGLNPSSSIY